MASRIAALLQRVFTPRYRPDPAWRGFRARAQTQDGPLAEATLAAPNPDEAARLFGVPLSRKGVQPIHLRITNRSSALLRLQMVGIDRSYFTPREAAGISRFSVLERLAAFGALAWVFVPLLGLIPLKLVTARRANRRMEDCFQSQALRLRPIAAGAVAEGFVFTPFEAGTKEIHVQLLGASGSLARSSATEAGVAPAAVQPRVDFTFSVPIAGIQADHFRRNLEAAPDSQPLVHCELPALAEHLRAMPSATTNKKGTGHGDPVNLVVIAAFDVLLAAFAGRWNETETITAATCWKTARAFLLGSEYRYSPVSPLFLFGRSQDFALQRARKSINERLHLRLWQTPLRVRETPVWVGQVSRDIGVRFTTKTWNLTTHRVDPDVDESRDYVVEDLLEAQRIDEVGYVDGVGACTPAEPRRNLTGDPYFSDGRRAVIRLSAQRSAPRFVGFA